MARHRNHELSALDCPESLEDVDLFAPGAQEHWYEAYEILHARAPVHELPGEGLAPGSSGFVLTKYADIARVVRDPERFRPTLSLALEARARARAQGRALGPGGMNAMIESMATLRPNTELWRRHRQELTDPWVGPGAERHAAMIRDVADELIEAWIGKGRVEFISAFARPLPQIVMAKVLGFPLADLPRLEAWGNAMVAPFVYGEGHRNRLDREQTERQAEVLEAFRVYTREQIEHKRAEPGDDMISFLVQVTYRALGRRLSDVEIIGIVYAMVIGGLETTQYAIEQQAQLLCEHPDLFEALRADRDKLRPFVEEALRVRAPTQGLSTRITTRDEEFQGVRVPAGSLLHLRWAAGNVDPDEYVRPHDIDLERRRIASHLSFSQGLRTCPGAGLSRLEQTIAWNRLCDRISALRYGEDNTFLHQPGIMLGTLELHLEFDAAEPGPVP